MTLINPHKSDVEFEADGRKFVIRLDLPAIMSAEATSGMSFKALSLDEGLSSLCALMFAGLQRHQPGFSYDESVALIETIGTQQATQVVAMSSALTVMPGGLGERDGPLKMPVLATAANGTGSGSTGTGAATSPPRPKRSGTRRQASPASPSAKG
jgi:hypothetical protein